MHVRAVQLMPVLFGVLKSALPTNLTLRWQRGMLASCGSMRRIAVHWLCGSSEHALHKTSHQKPWKLTPTMPAPRAGRDACSRIAL